MGLKLNNRQLSALADEILEKLKLDQKSELDALKAKYKKDKDVVEYDKQQKIYQAANDKMGILRNKIKDKYTFKAWSSIGVDNLCTKVDTTKEKIEASIILESIGADDVKSITEAVIKKFNK